MKHTLNTQPVLVRFDGIYADLEGDNLSFTFLSHFVGTGNRDYFKTSWIGINGLLRSGVRLEEIQIVVLNGGK
jgi:hypothetical protein